MESFNLLLCKTAVSLSAVLVAHSVLFISGQDTLSVLSSLLLHHHWSSIPHLFGRDHPLIIDSSTFGRASTADHDCSPHDHIWPSWSALTLLVSRWTLIIPDHPCWSTVIVGMGGVHSVSGAPGCIDTASFRSSFKGQDASGCIVNSLILYKMGILKLWFLQT